MLKWVFAGLVAVALVLAGVWISDPNLRAVGMGSAAAGLASSVKNEPPPTVTPPPIMGVGGEGPDFPGLVARLRPVVVNITTSRSIAPRPFDPFQDFFGPFFRRFPGRGPQQTPDHTHKTQHALGSGFIVDRDGYVVTNQHVIAGAEDVQVKLSDERSFDATVVGKDTMLDLALLKLKDASDLPAASMGSSSALRVGEFVLAIGNPFGLGNTVTHGIVSATGRVIGAGPYDDFIQTDASINPGNSGGPLFNMQGEVVGINALIEAEGRGIGFAIPVDALKDVLPQLRTTGHVARGKLGLAFQLVTPQIAAAIGLPSPKGALVAEVEKGGPADKAGLHPGDVVVAVDGQGVEHGPELARLVARHAPGTPVTLSVYRDKKQRELKVTLGALAAPDEGEDDSAPKSSAPKEQGGADSELEPLGVTVTDAPSGKGALVESVREGGPTDGFLRPGDIIIEADQKPVASVRDLKPRVAASVGRALLLRVRSQDGGAVRYVGIDLGKSPKKGR